MINTYNNWTIIWDHRRRKIKNRIRLTNNTYLHKENDIFVIRFYDKDILHFFSDNTVVFYSGNSRSVTTKSRLNKFGPSGFKIYQSKYVWYLQEIDKVHGLNIGEPQEFFDGISTNREENDMRKSCSEDKEYGQKILHDWLLERNQ